jgi:cellulose synthase/poly-beta-1,6-N-acetylglucosamine synthase-like glycosyltransferase
MAAERAIQDSLKRRKIEGEVLAGPSPGFYRVKYRVLGNPKVSIIIPMFNEAENAETTLKRVEEALISFQGEWEIIPVNDGSLDNTLEILKKIELKNKKIKILKR